MGFGNGGYVTSDYRRFIKEECMENQRLHGLQCLIRDWAEPTALITIAGENRLKLLAWSFYSNPFEIKKSAAKLLTNVTDREPIVLGNITTSHGGDHSTRWEIIYREGEIQDLPKSGFLAYEVNYEYEFQSSRVWTNSCDTASRYTIIPIVGRVPILKYEELFEVWCYKMQDEAYRYLLRAAAAKKSTALMRILASAAGKDPCVSINSHRIQMWRSFLRKMRIESNMNIIKKEDTVWTATCKAAELLGWEPSHPKPKSWDGYPRGIIEIPLIPLIKI